MKKQEFLNKEKGLNINIDVPTKRNISRAAGAILYAIVIVGLVLGLFLELKEPVKGIVLGVSCGLGSIVTAVYIAHGCYFLGYRINYMFGILLAFIAVIYSVVFCITLFVLSYGFDSEVYESEIIFCSISLCISWIIGLVSSIICPLPNLPDKEIKREKIEDKVEIKKEDNLVE